jgi:endoglucanase
VSKFVQRRGEVLDRRRSPRGGRRATDVVKAAVWVAFLTCLSAASLYAQPPAGWSTNGPRILTPAGTPFVINGINWYGFETTTGVAHGLWAKNYKTILDQMKQYGYNTVRVPFSNQMWETNPLPASSQISACPDCAGKHARDILALIVNYAGSIGLHVILDNHRSTAGNSAQENGLWYVSGYSEQAWITDWVSVQEWLGRIPQTLGSNDTILVNTYAIDQFPVVIGLDLRNEPHTPSGSYLGAATWGTGDGIDPMTDPNPNPFAPACVAASSCLDWRLAAERAADTIFGEAAFHGWEYPLIFVEGVGQYPTAGGNAASGPYSYYWWGGNLLGVNGNSSNAGAPIVLNAGGNGTALGAPISNQLVYSAHDYGPALYRQTWFNTSTCYATGCSSSSLADVWKKYWAYLNLPGGVNPVWPGHAAYPWANTGHAAITQAPVFIGEFGTANTDADLYTAGAGSQGQWNTDIVNFIRSSYLTTQTAANDSGVPVADLNWSYWSVNGEDSYALLASNYSGVVSQKKEYSFLCFAQQGLIAVPTGSAAGMCGSTGTLPLPDTSSPVVPAVPSGLIATAGNAQVSLSWDAVTSATAYNVKYATTNGGPYVTIASGIGVTSFTQTSLTNGTTYYYVVSATGSGGESVNSSQVSATPIAPIQTGLSIWSPTDGASLSGTQAFQALMQNMALSDYRMYWQVDGGKLNQMEDSYTGGAHKEAAVDVTTWTWRANGPYVVNFVAKNAKGNKVLAQKSVTIYVAH